MGIRLRETNKRDGDWERRYKGKERDREKEKKV